MEDGKLKVSAGSPWPAAARSAQNGAPGVTRPTKQHAQPLRLGVIALMSLVAFIAQAQHDAVDWQTIDGGGGGGTSTNGQYALSGTIGQHDASNAMTNGPYSLTGGF